MIRLPMQGPPYYDWGLDRWKIGVALLLFAALMIWLLTVPVGTRTTPPPSPTPTPIAMTHPQPGSVAAGTPQLFQGTAPANARIVVLDGSRGELAQTQAGADGLWSMQTDQPWSPGAYRLFAVIIDPVSGDELGRSGIIPLVALSAPLPPLSLQKQGLEPGPDGETLVLTGVAPEGVTVSAAWMENGRPMPLGQTQADAAGDWQLRVSPPDQAEFDLVLTSRDPTGAVVGSPVATRIAISPTGAVTATAQEMLQPTQPAPFAQESETAPTADPVSASEPTSPTPADPASGTGSGGEPVLLPIIGGQPNSAAPTVDTYPAPSSPAPPALPTQSSDTRLSLTDLGPGSRVKMGQLQRLTGTAAPNTQVQVVDRYLPAGEPVADEGSLPETILGLAQVDVQGRWVLPLTAPLGWGRHDLSLVQLDQTGAATARIGPIPVHVLAEESPPQAHQPVILAPAANGQISGADPEFVGTALAGSQLRVEISSAPQGSPLSAALAWVSNQGQWAVRLGEQLPEGSYWAQAIALDPSGTETTRSEPVPFAVVAPQAAAPADLAPADAAPTELAQADPAPSDSAPPGDKEAAEKEPAAQTTPAWSPSPVVVNTRLPRFSGTAAPGRLLHIQVTDSLGRLQQATVAANSAGLWSFVPAMPLAEGEAQAVVQMLGSAAEIRSSMAVRIAPKAALAGASATSLQIFSPAPGPQINRLPPIWGLAPPNSQITVELDGTAIATVQADSRGYWFALPPAPLADGDHRLTVSGDGGAGSVGPIALTVGAGSQTVTQPVISAPGPRADTANFLMTGMAQPGQAVVVVVNGVDAATVTADASGRWRWQMTDGQTEGPIYLQARILGDGGVVVTESPVHVVIYYVPLGG